MFTLDRRSLLAGGTSLVALASLGGCERILDKIANRPVRKDIASLATNDPILEAYRDAITQMQALPSSDQRNWLKQAEIHLNTCPHGNWFFLPWHRAYLMALDDIVRKLTGDTTFSMPYWNWTCQRSIPAPFWETGSVLRYTPTSNTINGIPTGPRTATSTSQLSDVIVGQSIINTIMGQTNFQLFASGSATALRGGPRVYGTLEGTPHNAVHGFVGGAMGDFLSPLDPIFWLHHCNIDRIWYDWNSAGNANTNDPIYTNFSLNGIFVDGDQQSLDYQVGALVLAPLLTYRYEDPQLCVSRIRRLDELTLRKLLEEGRPQAFTVLEELPAIANDLTISGRAPTRAGAILQPEAARASMEAISNSQLVLRLQDVKLDTKDENFFVRVYLGASGSDQLNPESSHYAGSFAFFEGGSGQEHDHGPVTFLIEVSETIERLQSEDRADFANGVDISFELVPVRDDERARAATMRANVNIGAIVPQLIDRNISTARPGEPEN